MVAPTRRAVLAALLLAASATVAPAAEPVRVGVLAPFSGPFSMYGKQFREAIDVYQDLNGREVEGRAVEFVFRDLEEANPAKANALARELILKEKVHYLGGVVFTPNALAIAPLAQEAKVPFVIFNAATSAILDRSEFVLRTSYTLGQVTAPVAEHALERGLRRVVTLVSDYGPGIDAETAFKARFQAGGGTVVESLRVPLRTTDFSTFLQRVRDLGPDAIYVFVPAGTLTYALVKAWYENGLKQAGIPLLGTGETEETTLQELGDAALGIETAFHYSAAHPSDLNARFTAKLAELHPGAVANFASMGAYDGAHVIYAMVRATKGARDGAAAVDSARGMAWESPRGPVSIDAKSRDFIQNVYLRVVERGADGLLVNREFRTFPAQPDPGRVAR